MIFGLFGNSQGKSLLKETLRTLEKADELSDKNKKIVTHNVSSVAPFRVINIGNSKKVKLLDFIDTIESILGKKANRNYLPMQKGDVPATWADASNLMNFEH